MAKIIVISRPKGESQSDVVSFWDTDNLDLVENQGKHGAVSWWSSARNLEMSLLARNFEFLFDLKIEKGEKKIMNMGECSFVE